jgi:hypothetical protein
VPDDDLSQPTQVCPGCGAVLVALTDRGPTHPGASAACSRLFEVTLRGLREDAGAHAATASTIALADAAYDAQHPVPGDDGRLRAALQRLGATADLADRPGRPEVWRTTIADVAADLDVIDLPVLVESWGRSVREDWSTTGAVRE